MDAVLVSQVKARVVVDYECKLSLIDYEFKQKDTDNFKS